MFQGFLRSRRGGLAVLAPCLICLVGVASGCASHQPATLAPVDKSLDAATVELQDPALKATLASARSHETAETLRQLAAEYHRLRIYDQADGYVSRALAQSPRDAASYDLRARVRRDWDAPELALPDANRAVYLDPKSAAARNTLGTILFALDQPAEAAKAFAAALALDPTAAWAQSNLCYVSLMTGDEATALARCGAALTLDPSLVVARNNLALVHAAAGRVDVAEREFMAGGLLAAGYYNLGLVLMARGEYARARDAFEAAGRAQPSLDAAFTRAKEARLLALRAAAGGK